MVVVEDKDRAAPQNNWKPGIKSLLLGSGPELPTAPASSNTTPMKCPECSSQRAWKDGLRYSRRNSLNLTQRYLCRDCGLRFSPSEPSERLQKVHRQILSCGSAIPSSRQVCVSQTKAMINLAEVEARTQEKAAGATTTIDAKTEFAEQLKRDGYSYDTIKNVIRYLKQFEKSGVNILHPEEVKAFIAEQQRWNNNSKATASSMYDIFCKYMHLQWTRPRYEYQQPIPFVPTEEQVDALIAGVGKRTAPFLQLLKETGARLGEAVKLKWTDIDLARGTVSINTPEKKSLPRILKISPTLITMLNVLPRTTAYVFIRDEKSVETNLKKNFSIAKSTKEKNFRDQRHKLARKLGNETLKQIHLHTFRHFYATMLYAKTLNILKVQQALGHKNLMNTQIYTHLINFQSDEYDVQIAETLDEAKKLLEAGFDYVTDMDGFKLFRKRK